MHPGWLMPSFDVADLARSLTFYEGLGFRRVGGKPEQGWAIVANGPIELGLYRGHFQGWMLNFRGDDVPALTARFQQLGLTIPHQSRYDPAHWPAEWSNAADGQPLPFNECGDCIVLDPDGRTLYFDTVPTERLRFSRGDPYATDDYDGSCLAGQPRLGTLRVTLATVDPSALGAFYAQLGLTAGPQLADGNIELSSPPQAWRIQLLCGEPPAQVFVLDSGTNSPARALADPDGYQLVLR